MTTPPRDIDLLLIEDDRGDALLVEALLGDDLDTPWTVRWARTIGEAAESVYRHGPPTCILLDLGLPDGRGLEAVHRVVELSPRSAVVVLTGNVDQDAGMAAVVAGAQDYLVKGQVDAALLSRSLRFALERRRAEDAAVRRNQNLRFERGLLPRPSLLADSDVSWATRYRPGSDEVLGGDFYDLVEQPDGTLRAIIGDVCGHGPDEAAVGVSLRLAWRALALAGTPPHDVVPLLDQVLRGERADEDLFVTLSDVLVSADRRTLLVHSCGHPPLLVLEAGAEPRVPTLHQGVPIGVLDDVTWEPTTLELPPAWSLLLYTDGLIEGKDGDGRLGLDGLATVVTTLWAQDAGLDHLVGAVAEEAIARNGGPLADDLAVLAMAFGGVRG